MTTVYPAAIDTSIELPSVIDLVSANSADSVNIIRDTVISIEETLGVNPATVYGTVRNRLDQLENTLLTLAGLDNVVLFSAGGDLSGTSSSQTVIRLQGRNVSSSAPSLNDVLTWNGSSWTPQVSSGSGATAAEYELSMSAGIFSNATAIFLRVGARKIDMTTFPATSGALTRTVTFIAAIDKTPGATNVEVQLYNTTDGVVVTGTNLTSSNNANSEVSAVLTVGNASGNLRNDIAKQYEVQIRMNGGGGSDAVFLTNARIVISYA